MDVPRLRGNPRSADLHATRCSGVAKQRLETKVHVVLDVAMKEREAWLVCDQIHGGTAKCGNDHRILHDACRGFAVELDKLEYMSVHMQGVSIVAAIVKHQAIAALANPSRTKSLRLMQSIQSMKIVRLPAENKRMRDHAS